MEWMPTPDGIKCAIVMFPSVMYGCPQSRNAQKVLERRRCVIGCGHVSGLFCGLMSAGRYRDARI